ncbi:MAG: ABC transporter ATP-binding protein [Thermoplasmata archaeon]|nr:ABC transporter ATP-binding protein [Thermoplasmata archaeon]
MMRRPSKKAKRYEPEDYAITIEKLRKEFDGLVAVNDFNLRIRKGVTYGLIGPNGSGKTTTIKMLMGLLRPTAGRATILGEAVPIKDKLPCIGYMPQDMAVYFDMSVHENLQLFSELYSVDKEIFEKREEELLKVVGLEERADSLVSQLSGGMRHRLSLACTLIHDPEILFLDEPTVGVDPELRVGFWGYFRKLKESGKTVVMTTHYMDEAMRCDVIGMMRAGRLIAQGSPKGLIEKSSTKNLEDAFLVFSRGVM